MSDLTSKRCLPCEGKIAPLSKEQPSTLLSKLEQWQLNATGTEIARDYKFPDYYQTMAFVNAIAWMAHQENHHPDLEVGYNHCYVRYSTHAIGGLSENDFICAAQIDQLILT